MRLLLLAALAIPSCAAPEASYELSLRAWLLAPDAERDGRAAHLQAMVVDGTATAGVRLAAVHQALRTGQTVAVEAWLDDEAGAFPAAAGFLAGYRAIMRLPERAAPASKSTGVLLVVVVDRTRQRDVTADFLATVERPLRERGHYVVPVEVGGDLLLQLGGELAALQRGEVDPTRLRRLADIGIGHCLVVDIVDFWVMEALAVEVVRHEVWYQLIDTAAGRVSWSRAAIDRYERQEPVVTFPSDEDVFYYPSSLGAVFPDQLDFVRAMNRGILRTVPAGMAVAPRAR